jgi:hypothetical protein
MIVFYSLVVMLFGIAARITSWRAGRMERRFVRFATRADELAKELSRRGGNTSHPDPLASARRQYELGRIVQIRDRYAEKYDAWEGRAVTCRKLKLRMLAAKGRVVPYLFGVADVVGVVALLSAGGIVDPSHLRHAFEAARMIVAR